MNAKYIYFNMSLPLDEKQLFDVVTKLTNPSKKLIYDSYIHKQITVDTLKVNLTINEQINQNIYRYEFPVVEPCYFEFHFPNVIMNPELWNKQYFPLNELILELPILKLNLNKQMLFIISDYIDHYLVPVLDMSILNQINQPSINKTQIKQAKLRQIIFKRLLEDFVHQFKFRQRDILSVCINDFKFKYSLTKIMQIIQLNCNMCNMYILKNDQTAKENLIPILETSNKITGKSNNIKDFFVLRAQLPLNVDSNNTYIPDPLFIYANINETHFQIRDELITWLSYKPTRGDDELLNLLILELFEDLNDPDLNENLNQLNKNKLAAKTEKRTESPTSSLIYKQNVSARSNKSYSVSSASSFNLKTKTTKIKHEKNVTNLPGAKPTIMDTYYDLLKSLHLQISVKPLTVTFKYSEPNKDKNDLIVMVLPQIDLKSAGTKCDLEEELISSKLVELPCTSLRACEKTSNKLPWLMELKGLQVYYYQIPIDSDINPSLFQNDKKDFFLSSADLNSLFIVKPKYHNHDNLLSGLSFILNIDLSKKIDFNLKKSHLHIIVCWLSIIQQFITNFKYKIDYKEFESNKTKANENESNPNLDDGTNTDWDETKSYSQVSILKEYDLSSFDENENIDDVEYFQDEHFFHKNRLYDDEDHCSLSEVSSSSSSVNISNLEIKKEKRKRKRTIRQLPEQHQMGAHLSDSQTNPTTSSVNPNTGLNNPGGRLSPTIYVMREKNEEQVQLNFTLLLSVVNINLNLVSDNSTPSNQKVFKLSLLKINSQLDANSSFQKLLLNLKKFQITEESLNAPALNKIDSIIFSSDPDCINKNLFQFKGFSHNKETVTTSTPSSSNQNNKDQLNQSTNINIKNTKVEANFLEVTFTRALVSNLNKKLEDLNNDSKEEPKPSALKSSNKKESVRVVGPGKPLRKAKQSSSNSKKAKKNWISELNVSLSNFDLILHANKFDVLIEFYIDLSKLLQVYVSNLNNDDILNQHLSESQFSDQFNNSILNTKKSYLIPIVKARQIPLLNIELSKLRVLLPFYNQKTDSSYDLIVAQIIHLNLTSQVENPIIRNFFQNAASLNIYNKAKSNGSLFRPGFAFEDRQYALEINNLAIFKTNSIYLNDNHSSPGSKLQHRYCNPILDNFDIKSTIGLPIIFNKRLINGYVLEVGTPTNNLAFYLGNLELNLLFNIINQNKESINKFDFQSSDLPAQMAHLELSQTRIANKLDLQRKLLELSQSKKEANKKTSFLSAQGSSSFKNDASLLHNKKKSHDNTNIDLEIVPLDILLTAENINFYFYTVDSSHKKHSLFWAQLIQPHLCLFMHEKLQKFEISIFDLSLKRSTPSSSSSSFIADDEYVLPNKSDFIMPVIETKPGEPNPKSGILNGVFSMKVNNFANLFCYDYSSEPKSNQSSNSSTSESKSNENDVFVCVCNECLQCYEFKANFNKKPTNKIEINSISNLESNTSLNTQVYIERPLRFKANFIMLSQLNQYLNGLDLFKPENSSHNASSLQSSSIENDLKSDEEGNEGIIQLFFDLNIHLSTSQVVFVIEVEPDNYLNSSSANRFSSSNFYVSYNSMSIFSNKIAENDNEANEISTNLFIKYLSGNRYKPMSKYNYTNHISFQLNDFQSKIQLVSESESLNLSDISTSSKSDSIHFLGPLSVRSNLIYNLNENELYSTINLDSFTVSVNKQLINLVNSLVDSFAKHSNKNLDVDSEFKANPSEKINYDLIKTDEEELGHSVIKHEDDLRSNLFKYSIVDENYLKQMTKAELLSSTNETNNMWLLSHVKLPKVNEVLCVDDMGAQVSNKILKSSKQTFVSSICWRYSTRRAIFNLKIQPLPFVGNEPDTINENESSEAKSISENTSLKCYLEYLNECTKRFVVLKEFSILEGNYTNVIENLSSVENFSYKNLVYSKVWRIRLSNEAKRFIYASSLLASTRIDTFELNQSSIVKNKQLFHSHVELNADNIQVKLNTINPDRKKLDINSAELISISLNEFSVRFLLNNYNSLQNGQKEILKHAIVSSYGHLSADYCEYRFLTMRSLIDSFQFKLTSSFNLHPLLNNLAVDLDFDTINLLVSQSALIAFKQIENEWASSKPTENDDWIPHHYLIYNDTNMPLNIKQYDTEETCLIKPGKNLAYTWRTHKKAQLMQLYMPKYRVVSKPFQINENGMQEICFSFLPVEQNNVLGLNSCFISCLVSVESKSSSLSPIHNTDFNSYKKKIIIQSKMTIANYLNSNISSFYLSYACNNKDYELSLNEMIEKNSRSNSTYELIQKFDSNSFEISSVKINDRLVLNKQVKNSLEQLRNGILCEDTSLNIKYWLNLYEQTFTAYVNQKSATASNEKIVQYCIVLTPLFVFCSYLPYELNIEILNKTNEPNNKHLIQSNSVSHFYKNSLNESNELLIKFDHGLHNRSSDAYNQSYLQLYDTQEPKLNWHESNIELLNETNYNVSSCHSNSNKKLIFSNLFKYVFNTKTELSDANDDINANVSLKIVPSENLTILPTKTQNAESTAAGQPNIKPTRFCSSRFEIEKKSCWNFSKTIRVDIKPNCLLINKTVYNIKIAEKVFKLSKNVTEFNENNQIEYSVDSNDGQLCLSDLGVVSNPSDLVKKYKFSIVLDEYSIKDMQSLKETQLENSDNLFNLNKNVVEYESEWIEIKDEQVTPFYREKQQYKASCLYLNKCWVDLKLFPKLSDPKQKPKFKLIYLVIQSDEFNYLNNRNELKNTENQNANLNSEHFSDLTTRLLTIRTKFLFKNKTNFGLRIQIDDEYLSTDSFVSPNCNVNSKRLLKRFIDNTNDDEDHIIKPFCFYSSGNVINKNNYYIDLDSSAKNENSESEEMSIEEAEDLIDKENINDLFYLKLNEISCSLSQDHKTVGFVQSKPLILTVKEKAIKQISPQTQNDENLLISRQCVCLYLISNFDQDKKETKSLICTQKLLVNKNGRLMVVIKEDPNYLVSLYNHLDVDVYVWPRISTNFIFENYIKNVLQINDKLFNEYKANKMFELTAEEKKHRRTKSNSPFGKTATKAKITIENMFNRSLLYMHLIPAKSCFKFNYDFIGTNQYPIENLNEQIFFMFGLVNNSKLNKYDLVIDRQKPFELSPNLCRLYENNFEVSLEIKTKLKFNYLGNQLDNLNQINVHRHLTDRSKEELFSSLVLMDEPAKLDFYTDFRINLNIDRLTLALNDDYLSQTYQTEILRLTSDCFNLNVKQLKSKDERADSVLGKQLDKKLIVYLNCQHFQLDNQMFDLDQNNSDDNLAVSAQKYDFPVIFIPREYKKFQLRQQEFMQTNVKSLKSIKNLNYFKSFDSFYYYTNRQIYSSKQNDLFLEARLTLISNKKAPLNCYLMPSSVSQYNDSSYFRLLELELNIKPFDIYLEDYLIYNLIKVGIEFVEFTSSNNLANSVVNQTDFLNDQLSYYNLLADDLDILVDPMTMMQKIKVGKIDALVSLQTSIKIYLATYKMPIFFDELKINGLPWAIMSSPQLVKLFTNHYLTSLLFRAGWLLGSLDLIGTPTAFIQQVSNGVYDFLQMPYRGLRDQGPSGLLQGFSNGSVSLIRNLSAGTITSLTSFASFVSRNMDILSFDPYHLARQEQARHQVSDSFGNGLLQVSSSFIISIMGAIGGLAEQPLQSVHNSDSILKGVSKGLLGFVTKPVGAVAELVNQTGQGLLKITGVNRVPPSELRLQRRALNKEFSRFSISSTKCLWKLISTSMDSSNSIHINAMIDAVYTLNEQNSEKTKTSRFNSGYNLTGCYLILSDEILYIVDKNDDMLLRAFYLSQIDIDIKKGENGDKNTSNDSNSSVLVVTLNKHKEELFLSEYQRLCENTIDRLVDYVNQLNTNETRNKDSNQTAIDQLKPEFYMPEYYRFIKIILRNYLNYYTDLPCVCGSLICMLDKKISEKPKLINKTEISAKPSMESNQETDSKIKTQHSRQTSTSELLLSSDPGLNKHRRQASNTNEIVKIHKINSGTVLSTQQYASSTSLNKQANLISSKSIHLSSASSNENVNQQKENSQSHQQQQFFYYVDPRLSTSFVTNFNSIKRKITNRGFQF